MFKLLRTRSTKIIHISLASNPSPQRLVLFPVILQEEGTCVSEQASHFIYNGSMPKIHFTTKPYSIGAWTIIRLPKDASIKLPSRGMTMVEGTVNDVNFTIALEPDGKGSHWFEVDKTMQKVAGASAGKPVVLAMEPTKEWTEPAVPADVQKALKAEPKVHKLWNDITAMARWDWIRWIRSTKQPETRARRISVTCSKLNAGERRPCCFNRSMCTEPEVCKNGVLLDPM